MRFTKKSSALVTATATAKSDEVGGEILHPTHRGETAMDGAPDVLRLGDGKGNSNGTMRGFFASLRMTRIKLGSE
jgi:hypothetical protein